MTPEQQKEIEEFLKLQRARALDPFGRCRCCDDGCDCGCLETCPLHKNRMPDPSVKR